MLERNVGQIAQEREAPAAFVSAFLSRLWSQLRTRSRGRHLRLCETLSLGEKRFLAVVEYDREKFLVAGTPQNISLLRCLGQASSACPEVGVPEASLE